MAVRSVATTQTLDNFRTTFNSLGTDVGDLSSLSTTAKGSIILAINEINTSVTGTGFTLSDGSTTQTIVTGNTLLVTGSAGISASVSATDTLTLAVANEIPQNIFADVLGAQHNADGTNAYTELVATVASKTTNHIYEGTGSGNGYKIDGVEAPFIQFEPGNTYRFNQADSSNSGHPIRFYLDAAKNNIYSTGVTTNGTPGSSGAYTQIVVSTATPQRLYYQCSSHGYMGNLARTSSTSFADTTGSAILTITGGSITDSSGTINFSNENLTTTGTIEAGTITQGGVGLATNAFAIAQAVALG
tara:strand:- start:38 stop:943 length:906 start_codon:yes stop_codon:yes gene_type:complete